MRNDIKTILSLMLIFALVVGCFAAMPLAVNAEDERSNPPDPKSGVSISGKDMTWNDIDQAAVKANFVQSTTKDKVLPSTALVSKVSAKSDASGDKISSNAHSGDYPGLYFYWNDKQKDDGFLKVDKEVFNLFTTGKFTITAKNANYYWDYVINKADGVETIEGYLLYQIPRYFIYTQINEKNGKETVVTEELKNINMIFISGEYKDAYIWINKIWLNEEGCPIVSLKELKTLYSKLEFNNGFHLGLNTVSIKTYAEATKGKTVTITENPITGFTAKQNPIKVTVNANELKWATFTNQKQWAYIEIKKNWDLMSEDSVAPDTFFNIYDFKGKLVYKHVRPGTYQVKAGTYKIVEEDITDSITIKGDLLPDPLTKLEGPWSEWEIVGTKVKDGITYTVFKCYRIVTQHQYRLTSTTSYQFVSVSVNGGEESDVNKVNIVAESGETYEIIFTNKETITPGRERGDDLEETEYDYDYVPVEEPKLDIIGKITSESHAGKWWAAGYGVVAVAGSTTHDGNYVVGISEAGFEQVGGGPIYLGYGSGNAKLDTIIAFYADGTYDVVKGPDVTMIRVESPARMYVNSPPHGINKDLDFEVLFIFNNVHGSGAMHVYLLRYND